MTDSPRDPLAEPPRHASETHATLKDASVDGHPSPVRRPASGPALIATRYRLERELGRGGAAIVWLARDEAEDREVAVKILRAEVANTVASDRFLEEIRIVTELSHPRLLPILDSGEWDGLLYYVTPYVERGSLRVRLERERQLPIADALAIVRDVADALEYAHQHGVIHRDIKPENILVDGDHALVADFGIARALTRAAGDRITSTGIAVGTPAYMSPEQAAGNRDLDHRTDVYSLACVLYEMIAGVTPFVGPTPESVIAQRFLHSPHPLRVYRPTVPPHVESAVERAMSMGQADRFRSIGAFADALADSARVSEASVAPRAKLWRARPLIVGGMAAAVLVAATALGLSARSRRAAETVVAQADSTRWVVASVDVVGARTSPVEAQRQLTDALKRWRDLGVSSAPAGANVASLAASSRAGRVVVARLGSVGDSVELTASLIDAKGDTLRRYAARAPSGDAARVARLYVGAGAVLTSHASVGSEDDWSAALATDRASAWRAYSRAQSAMADWDLASAIRDLRVAVAQDPDYAPAQLWLAQASAWMAPSRTGDWRSPAQRAVALSAHLSRRDSLLAAGVSHLATSEFPEACEAYARARDVDPASDIPWYGLGQCRSMDPAVVRDPRSQSGWRFRGAYHSAAMAYDSAIARARGAPSFAYDQLRRLLLVESIVVRIGKASAPDTLTFVAHPSVDHDTLAYVPYPVALFAASDPRTLPPTLSRALAKNADRLGSYFEEWVRRAPTSADARSSLAFIQELRGDLLPGDSAGLAALPTLRAAIAASADSQQRVVLTASMVRVLLKEERFADARRLADSMLAASPRPSPEGAVHLAGLAALLGKANRAGQLLAIVALKPGALYEPPLPPPLATAAARLTAEASLGECGPGFEQATHQVESLVDQYIAPEERVAARATTLGRPLSLAMPCLGTSAASRLPDRSGGRLMEMQRAFGRGAWSTVRAHFDTLERIRRVDRAGDIALDITFQEAWLLLQMRDTARARRHLCTPLSALSTLSTRVLRDVPQAAAVGRSLALCAELAARSGERAPAQRWVSALSTLWSGADAPLASQLVKVRSLVDAMQ